VVGFLKVSSVEDGFFWSSVFDGMRNVFSDANFIDNYRIRQYHANAMTRPDAIVRAGAKLRRIRVRLGLSARDVERLSMELAAERHNP